MIRTASGSAPVVSSGRRPALRRGRLVTGLVVGLAGLLLAAGASLIFGSRIVNLQEILDGLFSGNPSSYGATAVAQRVPRTVLAILVGASLGLSGAVMQGLTRNPIAEPGLLGVNLGAALAVVLGITVAGITTMTEYIGYALVGAALAAVVVYAVGSTGREGATPLKLALAGAATSAILASLVNAVLLLRTDVFETFRFWQVGGVGGAHAAEIATVAPVAALGAVLAFGSSRNLDVLSLGDDVARGLGVRIGGARLLAALAAVLLAGSATAIAGPIGFLGLVVPHAARFFTGPAHAWLLPYSAVFGAALLLVADVVGRVVARPGDLQVGIVTAVIGAPVFLLLLRRAKVREL